MTSSCFICVAKAFCKQPFIPDEEEYCDEFVSYEFVYGVPWMEMSERRFVEGCLDTIPLEQED